MKLIHLGLLMLLVQFCFGQTTDTYQYDGNGNMIADSHNNIAFVQYDIDNRPITIYKTNGTKIEYAYDASGDRVRKYDGTANTYYVHGADGKTEAVAKDDSSATVFHIDDIGYAERQGSNWIRAYYLKDHLGSIRMTLSDNGSVIGYDDYYPFGMIMPDRSGNSGNGAGRYKFTGKERDVETATTNAPGYDYFGARYYDSRIGRFNSVDRFATKYPGMSPYSYAANNPIVLIDHNGDSLITVNIDNNAGYIHGQTSVTIDHRYLDQFNRIIRLAVLNRTHIQINSSFRTTDRQMSSDIQDNGTTPAGDGSRHVAGLAIDFNLYQNNDPRQGVIDNNEGVTSDNQFVNGITNNQSRWGGDFNTPDPIHFDAGDNNSIQHQYGESFENIRDFNQQQQSQRGVTRTVNFQPVPPIRQLEYAPLNNVLNRLNHQ